MNGLSLFDKLTIKNESVEKKRGMSVFNFAPASMF